MFKIVSKQMTGAVLFLVLSCNLVHAAPIDVSNESIVHGSAQESRQLSAYDVSKEQELEEMALRIKQDVLRGQFKETSVFNPIDWLNGTILQQFFLIPTKEQQLQAYRFAIMIKDPELAQAIGTAGYQLDWTKWPIHALYSRRFFRIGCFVLNVAVPVVAVAIIAAIMSRE